jgi:hypothetical protein
MGKFFKQFIQNLPIKSVFPKVKMGVPSQCHKSHDKKPMTNHRTSFALAIPAAVDHHWGGAHLKVGFNSFKWHQNG